MHGEFLGAPLSNAARISEIRMAIVDLYNIIKPTLPNNCPMIIGGGFIRDGILGGQIGDIDVWIPANSTFEHNTIPGCNVVWQLATNRSAEDLAQSDYADISNLLVIETTVRRIKVNVIKKISNFVTPVQFVEDLMRGFDMEVCMMFIGFESSTFPVRRYNQFSNAKDYVIIPRSLEATLILDDLGTRISMGVNMERARVTSESRMVARKQKLFDRYEFLLDSTRSSPIIYEMDSGDVEPVPVSLNRLMMYIEALPRPRINNGSTTGSVLPTA